FVEDESMHFYRRNTDEWRATGCHLNALERGIFSSVVDVLVAYDDMVPPHADDKWWARECGCNPRTWQAIRAKLIAKGFLSCTERGLSSEMVKRLLNEARNFSQKQ